MAEAVKLGSFVLIDRVIIERFTARGPLDEAVGTSEALASKGFEVLDAGVDPADGRLYLIVAERHRAAPMRWRTTPGPDSFRHEVTIGWDEEGESDG